MKRVMVFFITLVFISMLWATGLENSYIYVYSGNSSAEEKQDVNPDSVYNGCATDAADGDFAKAELGTLENLFMGGMITAPMGYDQCEMRVSIDNSKTYTIVNIPIQDGNHVGSDVVFESTQGVNIPISALKAGEHAVQVHFSVSASDSKIMSLVDPQEGGTYGTTFFIAEGSTPICLTSFTAEAIKGTVELDWVTESETENSHFLVYRDGEVIGRVNGAGTTSEQHNYTYLDTRVPAGIHSYAIADVTYGGVEERHDAVVVEVGAEIAEADFVLNKAYPNPFNPRVTLSMKYGVGSNSVVNIYNTQGILVENLVNGFVESGTHEVVWDASNMPSGVYIVKMIVGDVMQSQKMVLLK